MTLADLRPASRGRRPDRGFARRDRKCCEPGLQHLSAQSITVSYRHVQHILCICLFRQISYTSEVWFHTGICSLVSSTGCMPAYVAYPDVCEKTLLLCEPLS